MIFPPLSSADPLAAVAFRIGVAAWLLAGLLLLSILLVRLLQRAKQCWRKRVLDRWRPLLMASLYEHPASLPPLSRFEMVDFLVLWNHLRESLGSEARDSLNRVASSARVAPAVSRMLRKGRFEQRLLAVRTAGNLRLVTSWDVLCSLLGDNSPGMSLAAAQALLRIDARRAIPLLVPSLSRKDWPLQRVVQILREAGGEPVAQALVEAIGRATPENASRQIRYLIEIAPAEAAPIIARQLADPVDDSLLITCIQALGDPGELEALRKLSRHANWHVRVHAASALGRLGTADDKALLTGMLGDSQWWVRYRAARALAQLPAMTAGELLRIKDMQTDSDARDMLHQVMAELGLQAGLAHG